MLQFVRWKIWNDMSTATSQFRVLLKRFFVICVRDFFEVIDGKIKNKLGLSWAKLSLAELEKLWIQLDNCHRVKFKHNLGSSKKKEA